MSKLWFTPSGKLALCDNGKVALADECPCGCPDFDGRSVIYVDKKATGTGDGSSWENAYTDIQTAVNAYPKKEIQIKGYGESDCYPAGIELPDCAYLHGMDTGSGAVWIDGAGVLYIIGIYAHGYTSIKLENINIKNCNYCFSACYNLINCIAKDTYIKATWPWNTAFPACGFFNCNELYNCSHSNAFSGYGFSGCENLDTCNSSGVSGVSFCRCNYLTDCSANGNTDGFVTCTHLTNCTAKSCSSHGFFSSGSCVNCIADTCGGHGFNSGPEFISCSAINNQGCGFFYSYSPGTYTDCSESNNCLSGEYYCNPSNPDCHCVFF